MKMRMAAVLLFCTVVSSAATARADTEYSDEDSEYLKVAGFFIEPLGTILEYLVFRPIHYVHHGINPVDPSDPGSRAYISSRGVCTGLRPRRECGVRH